MSEMGNEATSAVFNLAGKGIEATSNLIMAFLKYLLGHQERKAKKLQNKLTKAQIKNLKNSEYRKDAVEYLNTKKGIQDLKVLLSSGDKVIPLGQTLNKKDFKRFSQLADLYGVNFSANKDNSNKEKIKELKKDIKELEKNLSEEAKQKISEKKTEIDKLESLEKENRDKVKELKNEIKELEKDTSEEAKQKIAEKKAEIEKLENLEKENRDKVKELKGEIKELEKDISEEAKQKIAEKKAEIEKLESQKEQYIIFVRAKDLERVKAITDRMNMEIKVEAINNEHEKATTQEEKEEHQEAKDKEYTDKADTTNSKNNDKVTNDKYDEMNFEDVVNDFTDLGVDVPPIVICDRTNPNNYMVITSEEQIYEDRVHIDTNFDVYNNGEKQTCDLYKKQHGKFSFRHDKDGNSTSNKGAENWHKLKEEMKIKGGFTDNVVVFKNMSEYEKYKENFSKVKDKLKVEVKEITNEDGKSYKDYAGAVKQLKEQKEACYDKVEKDGSVTFTPKNEIAGKQAELIDKQIEKCEKLNATQNKLALAYEMKEDSAENTSDIDKKIEQLEKEIETLEKEVSTIQMKKESIASVEVLEDIKNNRENEKENTRENTKENEKSEQDNSERADEDTHREDENTQTKDQWEDEMNNNNNGNSKNDFGKDGKTKDTKTKDGRERE